MKKVGVITFHRAFNYGAILQAYALSKKIKDLNFDSEIVDITDPVESSKRFSFKRRLVLFARKILYLDRTIGYNKRCRKIKRFVKNQMPLSEKKYNGDNISSSNADYGVFVVGSDQVWNLSFKNNHVYLLDFVDDNNHRMSYAASFGYSRIPENFIKHSRESIQKFEAISVRENSGIEILKKQIGLNNGKLVVDPTLLFNKENWLNMVDAPITKKVRKFDSIGFVLYYAVAPQKKLLDLAIRTANDKHLKLIILNNSTETKVKTAFNFYDAGIEDFIYLFNKASYVFTTSFHGLAFSINFNKQFVFEVSSEKNNANDRLLSLVNELGLNGRSIDQLSDVDEKIDWVFANERMKSLREASVDYLESNLRLFEDK